ncbi:MAG: hypothetical protein EBZ77_02990 [Chitinophagia bacterium]|nr:hypothetical protein [Chitinophagia bacterium]
MDGVINWRAIGASVTGTAHTAREAACDDAHCFAVFTDKQGNEVLAACVADGAGSSACAATAAKVVVMQTIYELGEAITAGADITAPFCYELGEKLYDSLVELAGDMGMPLSDFYCTWLGAVLFKDYACFFQIGDGAIIRRDDLGFCSAVWMPESGEYLNETDFLAADEHMARLKVTVLQETIDEVAMLTDGLQMLCINFEHGTIHQPFFTGMFAHLQHTVTAAGQARLTTQLEEYLNSPGINERTDDDKTLFVATRKTAAAGNITHG